MKSPGPEANEGASRLREALTEDAAATAVFGPQSSEADVELICFTIHDQLYALPTTQVSAILQVSTLTELPHAPAHLCGVLSHQGRIVAVLDVAVLDGREPVTLAKRILIVEGAGLDAGVRVSQVTEIVRVEAAVIEPVSASLGTPEHVTAQLRRGEAVCFVMDAARLLERVRQRVLVSGVGR